MDSLKILKLVKENGKKVSQVELNLPEAQPIVRPPSRHQRPLQQEDSTCGETCSRAHDILVARDGGTPGCGKVDGCFIDDGDHL